MTSKLSERLQAVLEHPFEEPPSVEVLIDGERWPIVGCNLSLKAGKRSAATVFVEAPKPGDEPNKFVPSGTTIKVPIPEEGSKYVHPDMGLSVWRANRDHIVLMQDAATPDQEGVV